MSQPINLQDQLSAARQLSNTILFSASQNQNWPKIEANGQCEVAAQLINLGLCRLIAVEMSRVPDEQSPRFAAGLAHLFGEHIGRILKGQPSPVVQAAITSSIDAMLATIGADPARSAFNVTVSDHQQKEPLH